MNSRLQSHVFWGSHSPLAALTGCALLILSSSRLAFAVFCAVAILWDYVLCALVYFSLKDFMPAKGRPVILLFLSSLILSFFLLLVGLLNPLLVLGTWFFLILIPPALIGSGVLEELEYVDVGEAVQRVTLEAACLGFLIIVFSLIREPLGFGSLSLPGGDGGLFELFSAPEDSFFPIEILSVASGGLLLLGYLVAVYRHFRGNP